LDRDPNICRKKKALERTHNFAATTLPAQGHQFRLPCARVSSDFKRRQGVATFTLHDLPFNKDARSKHASARRKNVAPLRAQIEVDGNTSGDLVSCDPMLIYGDHHFIR